MELLLKAAQLDFGLVIVDIDSGINEFVKLIPSADKILLSVPPDTHKIGDV